jgi:hypothetical protein
MLNLRDLLTTNGIQDVGVLREAQDISPDGRFITVRGTRFGSSAVYLVDLQGVAIPEPSTWVLMGILLATSIVFARRRMR